MSFYAISFQGVAPFGAVASRIGAPYTLIIGGAMCILGASAFALKLSALRQAVRPIYAQIGIIPELVTGINTASVLQEPPED